VWGDDGGHVTVVDLGGQARRLSRNWGSLQGLAWHPDGREVWFTGTREGSARALQAVTLDGRERSLLRVAGVLTLHDLLRDGRALISHHEVRREMAVRPPGAAQERDLSWLDYCFPSDFGDDGQTVFFAENGEGGGAGYSVWLRRSDGAPAVRLGQGAAMALSPDGRWALASERYTTDTPQLKLIPTGAGQPREVPRAGLNTQAATFLPDGQSLLLTASESNQPTRVYVQDVAGGAPRPVAPPGTRFALASKPVTPDGRAALLRDGDGQPLLFDLAGGPPRAVAGLEAGDEFIRWSGDGRLLYAYRPGEVPARVFRVDASSGRREAWLELQPADRAGVLAVNPVQLTPDGRGYVYGYRRVLSDLYVVSGIR
jgi:hypothetical protein